MNESGIAVRKLLAAERVPLSALLIVVDDFSLPFGTLRFREGGSAGGHNGLTSISDELGTDKYPRLKIGIGDPRQSGTAEQHVLGEFSAAEHRRIPEIAVAAGEAIELWARSGLNKAATAFNGWSLPEPAAGSAADPANLPKAGEVDGPAGADGIRRTLHGWRKILGRDKADRQG
jgi:PTH1 family peptidyl-tRNA hydrolase